MGRRDDNGIVDPEIARLTAALTRRVEERTLAEEPRIARAVAEGAASVVRSIRSAPLAQRDVRRRLDDLERWGVPHQVAKLLTGLRENLPPGTTDAMRFVDEFLAEADTGAINLCVLAGGLGTGKSVAGAYFLEHANPDNAGRPWRSTAEPLFLHVAEIMVMGLYEHEEERQRIKAAKALVIDDQGVEYLDGKGAGLALFDWLINARYGAAGYTVITTNLDSDAMKDRYGMRIYDRLREQAAWFDIEGASLRRSR